MLKRMSLEFLRFAKRLKLYSFLKICKLSITSNYLPPFLSSMFGYPGKVKSNPKSSIGQPSIVRFLIRSCRSPGVNLGSSSSFRFLRTILSNCDTVFAIVGSM